MEEIAERAGLGMGMLYRHFATKHGLLAAIVGRRFSAMAELARAAERIEDPEEAFENLLWTYLEAAERDAAFRLALLGPEEPSLGRDLRAEGRIRRDCPADPRARGGRPTGAR